MKCPHCGQPMKEDSEIDMMAARSEYEAEINRLAEEIMREERIKCYVTACEMAKKKILKGRHGKIK